MSSSKTALSGLRLPEDCFLDSFGSNREEVMALFEEMARRLSGWGAKAEELSPLPEVTLTSDSWKIPMTGMSREDLMDHLSRVVESSMNPAVPGYIGHMDSIPTTYSVLGDLVISMLNNNMLSLEMSPALSRLEQGLTTEIARLFGFGESSGGHLVSGGTLANLQALTVARNQRFQCGEDGLTTGGRPVILASEVAHVSLQKAAMVLGLGSKALLPVKVDADSRMDVEDLRAKIEDCKREGWTPFCVVATAGTTTTGSIDPLEAIQEVAEEHALWLHVDAAYGGALVFSPRNRHLLQGIEKADSITFNPQKWLYIAKTCAMILFRDLEVLENSFRISAPYVQDAGDLKNLGDYGLQGTRRGDVLKLWLSLLRIGREGYGRLIDEGIGLTRELWREVARRPYLEVASDPDMNILCFRGVPSWIPREEWDRWNAELQQKILKKERIFLSTPRYRRNLWLRVVMLNPFTDRAVVLRLMRCVDAYARPEAVGG